MKIIYLTLAALLCGCASESFSTGSGNLSRSLVDQRLVNGKTTKAQVVALLGEPKSSVSGNVDGVNIDTWTYARTFYRDAADTYGFAGAVLYSMANPYSGGYDRVDVSTLTITFDSSGRVTGHTFGTSHIGG